MPVRDTTPTPAELRDEAKSRVGPLFLRAEGFFVFGSGWLRFVKLASN